MALRKKAAALVAAGAGLAVVGAGVAASTAFADPTPTPPNSTSSSYSGTGEGGGRGHGQGRAHMASELATKLGLDQTKVSDALKAVRDERQNQKQENQQGQRPDPATMEADLAKALAPKLGVDEAKVKTALDQIRTEHQAQHAQQLKTRLDQAVKDGKLTQAEADAVQKAAGAGVIGGGRR